MQEYFITKGSTKNMLRMELINDGQHDVESFYNELDSGCTVVFSMINIDTGQRKVSNGKAYFILRDDSCTYQKYDIGYKWSAFDVSERGVFKGIFTLKYANGEILNVPIEEDLIINVV